MRELSKMDKEMILQTYNDADNKRKAINALAKVCDVDAETIRAVIKDQRAAAAPKEIRIKEPANMEELVETIDMAAKDVIYLDLDKTEDGTKLYETKHKKDPAKAAGPLPDYIQSVLFFKLLELEKEIDHMEDQLKLARQRHQQLREFLFN